MSGLAAQFEYLQKIVKEAMDDPNSALSKWWDEEFKNNPPFFEPKKEHHALDEKRPQDGENGARLPARV